MDFYKFDIGWGVPKKLPCESGVVSNQYNPALGEFE
jgi:hypothetical protein